MRYVCASTGEKDCQLACQRRMHAQLQHSNHQQRDQKRYKYTRRVLGTYKKVICIHLHIAPGSPTSFPTSLISIKPNHSRSLPEASRKRKLFSLVTHPQALRIAYPRKLNPHSSISPPRIHSAKQGKDGIDAIFCATRKRARPFDPKVRGYPFVIILFFTSTTFAHHHYWKSSSVSFPSRLKTLSLKRLLAIL